MRIHLKISSDGTVIPFDHQKKLAGTIHKWIGKENSEHGNISLYSYSMLTNGKRSTDLKGLIFERGTTLFISAHKNSLIKNIINAIKKDPILFNGLKVAEIVIQEDPDLSQKEYFLIGSPVLTKRKVENGRVKHFSYDEGASSEFLKETLINKMAIAGLSDNTLRIEFDKNYPKAKTKVINYGGIKNKANICPVIIQAKPETKVFAWNVGIGNSTGIGFGAII
jgi:CRISPR-associated endoribonuclease Cas6